jgi:hypothetical protein
VGLPLLFGHRLKPQVHTYRRVIGLQRGRMMGSKGIGLSSNWRRRKGDRCWHHLSASAYHSLPCIQNISG